MPVNIPTMGGAMRGGLAGGGGGAVAVQEASATFIPPHQFSQRDEFTMGSFVPGETPGEQHQGWADLRGRMCGLVCGCGMHAQIVGLTRVSARVCAQPHVCARKSKYVCASLGSKGV